ncbi:hypothetical protein GCM10020331_047060 [Ectobacillus funiculus]
MLPTAIKASYKKQLLLKGSVPEEVQLLFRGKETLDWEELEKQPHIYKSVRESIAAGAIELVYKIKDRVQKKKTKKVIRPVPPEEELEKEAASLRNGKQQDVLYYFS